MDWAIGIHAAEPRSMVWGAQGEHFVMAVMIPHNCGHARLQLHLPEGVDPSDALCVGSYRRGGGLSAEASDALPRDVFRARLAAGNRTVDVVVGGGHAELKLSRCL